MSYLSPDGSQIPIPTWINVVVLLIVAAIGASGSWLTLAITRRRSSTVKAEDYKTEAEARSIDVHSMAEVYEQLRIETKDLRTTRAELAEIVDQGIVKARELRQLHASQIEFLQGQIRGKTESEREAREDVKTVRDRFHAASGELQRCTIRIRDYEEILRLRNVEFIPFDFTAYKRIMEGFDKGELDALIG